MIAASASVDTHPHKLLHQHLREKNNNGPL